MFRIGESMVILQMILSPWQNGRFQTTIIQHTRPHNSPLPIVNTMLANNIPFPEPEGPHILARVGFFPTMPYFERLVSNSLSLIG
jgi:hypothetical protein